MANEIETSSFDDGRVTTVRDEHPEEHMTSTLYIHVDDADELVGEAIVGRERDEHAVTLRDGVQRLLSRLACSETRDRCRRRRRARGTNAPPAPRATRPT